jgi:hypothetical protein
VGGRPRDEDAVGELVRSLERDGDVAALRAEVDRAFRTRRFLDYRQSIDWARSARPMVAELRRLADDGPSAELVELLQRAAGQVVKTIMRADDSSGSIGDVAEELLEAHAVAVDAGVADPVKLAGWMFRFRFKDQDFFEPDPVRYQEALGEAGLRAYRDAVAGYDGDDSFAVRYARERLAIIDGDADFLVELLGGDLTRPHQFQAIADAMVELGRDDLALEWATRGIRETDGWQVAGLYELACVIHARRRESLEVLRWRRAHHERMPSSSTYAQLREAAEAVSAWSSERDAGRVVLREHDPRDLVVALLGDGDADLAWETAVTTTKAEIGSDLWLRLAESRQEQRPDEALAVYERLANEQLLTADRRAYAAAVRILKKARDAASAAGTPEAFTDAVARLRDTHRRRPTLIAMLDKAGMTS